MSDKQKLRIFLSALVGNYLAVHESLRENKEDYVEFMDDACDELLSLLELKEMTHKERHRLLHRNLDELVADFINHTHKLPSQTSILDLMKWSAAQMENPTESETEGKSLQV